MNEGNKVVLPHFPQNSFAGQCLCIASNPVLAVVSMPLKELDKPDPWFLYPCHSNSPICIAENSWGFLLHTAPCVWVLPLLGCLSLIDSHQISHGNLQVLKGLYKKYLLEPKSLWAEKVAGRLGKAGSGRLSHQSQRFLSPDDLPLPIPLCFLLFPAAATFLPGAQQISSAHIQSLWGLLFNPQAVLFRAFLQTRALHFLRGIPTSLIFSGFGFYFVSIICIIQRHRRNWPQRW